MPVKGQAGFRRKLLFGSFFGPLFFHGLGRFLFGLFTGVLTFSHRDTPCVNVEKEKLNITDRDGLFFGSGLFLISLILRFPIQA